MSHCIFCARNLKSKKFGYKPGKTNYFILKYDDRSQLVNSVHEIIDDIKKLRQR
jgi:hypothetical protein